MAKEYTCNNPAKVAARAICLAFQASQPVGMGYLQYNPATVLPEDKIIADAKKHGRLTTDYVEGRMVKAGLMISDTGVTPMGNEIRADYQSWATVYASYEELLKVADGEING